MGDDAYDGYTRFKNWDEDDFGRPDEDECRFFEAEVTPLLKNAPVSSSILEVGFGNGHFLGWAKGKAARVCGSEVQSELAARAERMGIAVVRDLENLPADSFDLIAAFDVFEHIPYQQLVRLIGGFHRALKPGGALLARFPNGDSPFSLPVTHGDATHVTVLGAGMVHDMMGREPWQGYDLRAPAEPSSGVVHGLKITAKKGLRALFRLYAKAAYLGQSAPSTFTINYMLVATKR